VSHPLDAAKFEQNPCDVINQAQAGQIANLTKTRMIADTAGPICRWSDDNYNSVAFSFVHGNGLSDVYQYQDSQSGYFKVAPDVSGYPAVFSATTDDRLKGGCQMGVGIRNDEVMTVLSSFVASSPYYGDPCSLTQKAAEAAIATLKGAS
jgi:hypothetical protein